LKISISKKTLRIFLKRIKEESSETKNAAKIVAKYLRREKLTTEEEKELRQQFYDVLKIAGIGVPFAIIPGSAVLLPLLIAYTKKKGLNILPSSFNKQYCECGNLVEKCKKCENEGNGKEPLVHF